MFRFLVVVLFFIFVLLSLAGFSVIRSFKSFFFNNQSNRHQRNRPSSTGKSTGATAAAPKKQHKLIPKDEGEYVEYEEVE